MPEHYIINLSDPLQLDAACLASDTLIIAWEIDTLDVLRPCKIRSLSNKIPVVMVRELKSRLLKSVVVSKILLI